MLQSILPDLLVSNLYSDENAFRMEEEMARLAAEKEAVEMEKKALARELDRLQRDYVLPPTHRNCLRISC